MREEMETRENLRQSLEAQVDELERQIDQIADRAAHTSADAENRLRSQLSPLRTRLAEVRTRLREKVDADDRADDAALAELGHELNDVYAELAAWPRHGNSGGH
jgi:regulator of replication initiation timing